MNPLIGNCMNDITVDIVSRSMQGRHFVRLIYLKGIFISIFLELNVSVWSFQSYLRDTYVQHISIHLTQREIRENILYK